ncbi:MAG: hypothetical protein ACYC6H_10050 [Bellilinea sp.]
MSRDLRQYSKQTIQRLIAGGLILLFAVGGALIFHFYGGGAAILGVVCLLAGLMPIGIIILILGIMEWIVERNRDR